MAPSPAPSKSPRRYLAIEIGGTKLQLVVGDQSARILHRHRADVDPHNGGPVICGQIEEGIAALKKQSSFDAIGVGFGGPIDWRNGRICRSHQVPGWENFELAKWLGELTAMPVAVDNDSNLACLAETLSGAGRGANPVFYMNMGSGVGGGLCVDGRIYHGDVPGECEFGHIRLDRSGATVESRCSGWAIDARIRALRQSEPASLLCKLIGEKPGGEAKYLPAALRENDPAAKRIVNDLAADLAFAFSHVVHLLHPQRIVMGGGLSLIGEPLRAAVAAKLPACIMEAFAPGPQVVLAALGEDVVPVGALHLAMVCTK